MTEQEQIKALIAERESLIATKREQIEALEKELTAARRTATDRRYMMDAYRTMLGPNGLKMALRWEAGNVLRVHYSWGPDAFELTGEERAALMLEWDDAAKNGRLVENVDGGL